MEVKLEHTLNALASETMLIICQTLDDNELLILCQVSRRLHSLSLATFFLRHGISEVNIKAGNISLSSNSLRGVQLALFISSINNLSCVFDRTTAESDLLATERLVSRLPRINDVEVAINEISSSDCPADGNPLSKAVLSLLLVLISEKLGTLFILQDGNFHVSKPRRMVQYPQFLCFNDCRGPITCRISFFAPVGLFLRRLVCDAVQLAFRGVSIIMDPLARSRQDDRVIEDLRFESQTPHSFHVRFPMLPTSPFTKWTMITFNNDSMTRLIITNIPPLNGKWGSLLLSIHLPLLRQLTIGSNVNLDFSDFLAFVSRHSINDLCFGHFSISYLSLTPLLGNYLSHLVFIAAPARLMNHILRSPQDFRSLRRVDIGPVPSTFRAYFGIDYPDDKAKVETPFSFDDLNEALHAVADAGATNLTLTITLPAGLRSEKWLLPLDDDRQGRRVERRLHNVTIVHLCMERSKELYPTHPLLPQWFALFPSASQIWITGVHDPTAAVNLDLVESIYSSCPQVLSLDDVVILEVL